MAAEQSLRLVGFSASPYVARARVALNLKRIDYEFVVEEFGKKSQLLIQSNPVYKKVPVLIHRGNPISESLVILHYIDEVWAAAGPPILPADPYDRATARFWAAYIDDKLPAQSSVLFNDQADEAEKEEAKVKLVQVLEPLEEAFKKCSGGNRFFGGDTIGYIDIVLGSCLGGLKAMEVISGIKLLDEAKIPRLVEWADCFCSSDAVKGVIDVNEMVEFVKLARSLFQGAANSTAN
ncbi:Glutathione S-transferase U18 [Platanthera guangdongensis]|uniref:glutathione transferase n=1 Tax=Platanthera guangdongensis TaxID=2320717 RepID=A0ABR2LN21_9ASPA